MRQASLKLKMYRGALNIVDNNNLQSRLFQILLMSFGALALCYAIILGTMVMNIVERRALEREGLTLSSEVGELELNYLSLSNKVDLALSAELGFKEVKPKFATRKSFGFTSPITKKSPNEI